MFPPQAMIPTRSPARSSRSGPSSAAVDVALAEPEAVGRGVRCTEAVGDGPRALEAVDEGPALGALDLVNPVERLVHVVHQLHLGRYERALLGITTFAVVPSARAP